MSAGGPKLSAPRVLVCGGKDGRWAAQGKTVDDALATGVQSWTYAFNGDYAGHRDVTRRDLGAYDIVIVNTNQPIAPLRQLAQDRPPSVRWVSLIEGSAHEYYQPDADLKALLDASDLVNVINRHSVPLFRGITRSPVEYIGIPYPVDGVKRFVVPIDARARRLFLCAHLSRRWNEYLAARAIGLPYYGYDIRRPRPSWRARLSRLLRTGAFAWDPEAHVNQTAALYRELYGETALGITTYTKDAASYFTEHASSYLWMDLDSRYTWARFVLDAAALGIPIITTASTHHGQVLFPETTLAHALEIDRASELATRLCRDREFYEHVASYPADKMDFLKAETMKRALLAALRLG